MSLHARYTEMLNVDLNVRVWISDKPWVPAIDTVDPLSFLTTRQEDMRMVAQKIKANMLNLDLTKTGQLSDPVEDRYLEGLQVMGEYLKAFETYFRVLPTIPDEQIVSYIDTYEIVRNTIMEIMSVYVACWLIQISAEVKRRYYVHWQYVLFCRTSWASAVELGMLATDASIIEKTHDFDEIQRKLGIELGLSSNLKDFWIHIGLLLVKAYVNEAEKMAMRDGNLGRSQSHLIFLNMALISQLDFCRFAITNNLAQLADGMKTIDAVRVAYMGAHETKNKPV